MNDDGHQPAYRRHQLHSLGLAAAAFAASAPGQSFLISVFVDDFLAGTDLSRTTFSILYAAGTVISASAMILLGRVMDRRGLRPSWIIVAAALAAACGLASVATGALTAFLALALLRTSGQGSFPLIGTLLVARNFGRRRGQAVALANLGLTLSSMALPPLTALLIVHTDWRTAYQVLAVVLLIVVLPLGLLVRGGPARAGSAATNQGDTVAHPAPVRPGRRGLPALPSGLAARLLLILAGPPLISTAVTFHAVSILAERGVDFLAAGGTVGILGATSALGVVLAGLIVDRLTTRAALLGSSATVLAATCVLLVPSAVAAYVAFACLGLGMGATGVLNGTIWARTFGTVNLGRVQGMAQSATITAAAIAPMIPAVSVALSGSHTAGLLALALIAVIASAVAWSLRDPTMVH
ncbi:MFS transporter [Pseudactinotalea sp. Z1748]|uniref:MFS transporter n=1 Tax=Pseudactinotalea sp. Z1748 TaxID=3413027 RepID=UPI003C79DFA5